MPTLPAVTVRRRAVVFASREDQQSMRPFISALEEDGFDVATRWIEADEPSDRSDRMQAATATLIVVFWSEAGIRRYVSELSAVLFRASADSGPPIITIQLDRTPLPSSLYRFETLKLDASNGPVFLNEILSEFRLLLKSVRNRRPLLHGASSGRINWTPAEIREYQLATKRPRKASPPKRRKDSARAKAQNESELLNSQIKTLNQALRSGQLSLFCGAGVSANAGIPAWGDLLARLVHQMVDKMSTGGAGRWTPAVAQDYRILSEGAPLIMAKHLKNHFKDEFPTVVRGALYSSKSASGPIIDEIVELARPQRESDSIDSIVVFNFDALIEENLLKSHITHKAIYSELVNATNDELPVYHVHGYLPRQGTIPDGMQLVFSEDGYHSQFLEPFTWANLIQLQKLTQNVCLFVGISLTDPNMRRLVDVAWRKGRESKTRHYIIWRAPDQKGKVPKQAAKALAEQDANALGLNVIWVENFDKIANILRLIRTAGQDQAQVGSNSKSHVTKQVSPTSTGKKKRKKSIPRKSTEKLSHKVQNKSRRRIPRKQKKKG